MPTSPRLSERSVLCGSGKVCRITLAVPSFSIASVPSSSFRLFVVVLVAPCIFHHARQSGAFPKCQRMHTWMTLPFLSKPVEVSRYACIVLSLSLSVSLSSQTCPYGRAARGKQQEPAFPFCMLASNVDFMSLLFKYLFLSLSRLV